MSDEYYLLLDTSTDVCSVALATREGIEDYREAKGSNKHSEQLAPLAASLLDKIDFRKSLRAVGVANGPGSYTGLRIGASYAKGLCWSLGIPLVSVMTTELLALTLLRERSFEELSDTLLLPMIDARRMEVYTALYRVESHAGVMPVTEISAVVLTDEASRADLLQAAADRPVLYFGDGAAKADPLLRELLPDAQLVEGVRPGASAMAATVISRLDAALVEDVAYWEPFYLKEYKAKKSVNKVLSRLAEGDHHRRKC